MTEVVEEFTTSMRAFGRYTRCQYAWCTGRTIRSPYT